jgi:hypothetical protein
MVGKLGIWVPPMALLGGKAGWLLMACGGILLIAVLWAGKLCGIPSEKAMELKVIPAMAIKPVEMIFFMICFTLSYCKIEIINKLYWPVECCLTG